MEQAGATTRLLSIKDGEIQGMHHDKPGGKLKVDGLVAGANVDDFDALILPGGVANPNRLRMDEAAVRLWGTSTAAASRSASSATDRG